MESPSSNKSNLSISHILEGQHFLTQESIIILDFKGLIRSISDSFIQELHYNRDDLLNTPITEFVHADDKENTEIALKEIRSGRILTDFESRIRTKIGAYLNFSWIGIPFFMENRILGIFRNITLQREIEKEFYKQELKYKTVFETLPMGIAITDENGFILETNKSARDIFEIDSTVRLRRSLNHKRWAILNEAGSNILPREFRLFQALKNKEFLKGLEFGLRKEDGTEIWLEVMASPLGIEGYGMAVGFKDISERKKAEARSTFLSNYDETTGLPRRKYFIENTNILLEESLRHNHKLGMIALDIDNFKYLNDSFGHGFGDLLLKEVASLIKRSIRNYDIVSREGGDEFLIALPDIEDETDTAVVCESIQDALSKPIQIGTFSAFTSISMGIAIYPNDGKDPDTLIKNADNALHQAKKKGKNSYSFYTSEMEVYVHRRLETENNLRHALKKGEFCLYYQPKVAVGSHRILGAEALIRWIHPEKGLIPPVDFISLAEETGLIVPLGEWVMKEAIHTIAEWKELFGYELSISVNLSAKQLGHEGLIPHIEECIATTKIRPSLLDIEITESSLMDNAERAIELLNRINELGVTIAIDDFGTGYSSLGYLKKFPVKTLKIDRSFIMDLEKSQDSQVIVKAVINLGHNLGLQVVAEGAETKRQSDLLEELGVDSIQGYYFSKPLPKDDFFKNWGMDKTS